MTIHAERTRSLIYARDFLRSLLDPKKTPKVPKAIRREAYYRLKHYPSIYDIQKFAMACPDILDPVTKEDVEEHFKGE